MYRKTLFVLPDAKSAYAFRCAITSLNTSVLSWLSGVDQFRGLSADSLIIINVDDDGSPEFADKMRVLKEVLSYSSDPRMAVIPLTSPTAELPLV